MSDDDWTNKLLTVAMAAVCFAIALFFVGLFLAFATAHAQPPDGADPELAPWFRGLANPTLGMCCDIADCRITDNWRLTADGYEVLIDERWPDGAGKGWQKVPVGNVLLRVDNPTGGAVACWYSQEVRCFVRPVDT